MSALKTLGGRDVSDDKDLQRYTWHLVYEAICNWMYRHKRTESLYVGGVEYVLTLDSRGAQSLWIGGVTWEEEEFIYEMIHRTEKAEVFYSLFTIVCCETGFNVDDTYESVVETLKMIKESVNINGTIIYYDVNEDCATFFRGASTGCVTNFCVSVQLAVLFGEAYGTWQSYTTAYDFFISSFHVCRVMDAVVGIAKKYKSDAEGIIRLTPNSILPGVRAANMDTSAVFCVSIWSVNGSRIVNISTIDNDFVGALALRNGGGVKAVCPSNNYELFEEGLRWTMSTLP